MVCLIQVPRRWLILLLQDHVDLIPAAHVPNSVGANSHGDLYSPVIMTVIVSLIPVGMEGRTSHLSTSLEQGQWLEKSNKQQQDHVSAHQRITQDFTKRDWSRLHHYMWKQNGENQAITEAGSRLGVSCQPAADAGV
jgi:hypothetical protein